MNILKDILVVIIIGISMVSCAENKSSDKVQNANVNNVCISSLTDDTSSVFENNRNLALEEIRSLSSMPNIDEVVIIVNEYGIPRIQIELARINNKYTLSNPKSEKDIIANAIRGKVVASEADKLRITPNQKSIDEYINFVKDMLHNDMAGGMEIKEHINALGVTEEEYLKQQADNIYFVYQNEEFRKYIEAKNIDYDKYVDDLVGEADIQFNDKDIERIYMG